MVTCVLVLEPTYVEVLAAFRESGSIEASEAAFRPLIGALAGSIELLVEYFFELVVRSATVSASVS